MKENKPISELLLDLIKDRDESSTMTIAEINHTLLDRGFGLLMVLFSFPMAVPLPYPPGFTTILGAPLLFFAIQMMVGMKEPYLPKWVGRQKIKVSHLSLAINKTHKYFVKIEGWLKPRLLPLTGVWGERVIGFFSVLCAISIVLPIWLGNAVPSAGIFLMALGLLGADGLFVIIGMVVGVAGLFIAAAVVILGVKAVKAVIAGISSWLF